MRLDNHLDGLPPAESKEDTHNHDDGYAFKLRENGIQFDRYPFWPSCCSVGKDHVGSESGSSSSSHLLPFTFIREIIIDDKIRAEIRTINNEIIFLRGEMDEKDLDSVQDQHGVPIYTRKAIDLWSDITEPFLDMEVPSIEEKVEELTNRYSIPKSECEKIYSIISEPMIAYNSMLWDYVSLDLFDVLSSLDKNCPLSKKPLSPNEFKEVYKFLMEFTIKKSTPNQVITLNVGGILYTTFKETLSHKIHGKDHLLSIMFSDDGCSGFDFSRDERGNIFLDRNGHVFSYILDYLRAEGNIEKFALPFHDDGCLMEQLEMEVEYFSLIDLSIMLRGRRKCFKIEKKKYTKSKTPTNNQLSLAQHVFDSGDHHALELGNLDKELDEEDEDTSSVVLEDDSDEDEDEDDNDDLEYESNSMVGNSISTKWASERGTIIDDSSDDEYFENSRQRVVLTPNSTTIPSVLGGGGGVDGNETDEVNEDEDSVSTFDAAIKSVNQVPALIINQSLKPPSPSIAKQKHHRRTKSTSLFHSYHNIKHRICNEKGEPVIGYSEDASVCYIFPNLSRYYYPIICKQPIQLRGIDRRFAKSHNYYEITIRSDLEDRIDYVNYNIPGIVVAIMTNNQIKTIKQHHKKDLPIDLKKETVSNFNLKNGSYYSNEDAKHVIAIRRYLCGDRVGVHIDTTTKLITFYYNDNVLFTSQFQYDDFIVNRSRLYFVVLVKSMYGVVPSFIHLRSHAQHPFKYSQVEENDSTSRKLKTLTKRLGDILSVINTETEPTVTTGVQGKTNKR